jgi:hypothetical protein
MKYYILKDFPFMKDSQVIVLLAGDIIESNFLLSKGTAHIMFTETDALLLKKYGFIEEAKESFSWTNYYTELSKKHSALLTELCIFRGKVEQFIGKKEGNILDLVLEHFQRKEKKAFVSVKTKRTWYVSYDVMDTLSNHPNGFVEFQKVMFNKDQTEQTPNRIKILFKD